jgi:hypothetical protein
MAAARAQNAAVELDPRVERSRRVILEAVEGTAWDWPGGTSVPS